ncbi:MAG: hypothetical protein E6176_14060, partial [Clostridium celatum]|nr:hypothetical protein [Clostridium celatum]
VEEIGAAVHDVMLDTHPVLHLPDFLSVFEGACVLTDHRVGFVFGTGDVVTLDLPGGWTPTGC